MITLLGLTTKLLIICGIHINLINRMSNVEYSTYYLLILTSVGGVEPSFWGRSLGFLEGSNWVCSSILVDEPGFERV